MAVNCLITIVNKLYVAWRKAMRQLFNIDYRTHNYIVFIVSLETLTQDYIENCLDIFLYYLH